MPGKRRNRLEIIEDFEKAVRTHEMVGCMDPEDHEEIEKAYKKAKKDLYRSCKIPVKRNPPVKEEKSDG